MLRKRPTYEDSIFALRRIEATSGTVIEFSPGDIVFVVGPNNSGKSTLLKEIRKYLENPDLERVAVARLLFSGATEKDVRSRIDGYFHVVKEGGLEFVVDQKGNRSFYVSSVTISSDRMKLGEAVSAFISFLNSEGRLVLSSDVQTMDLIRNRPSHPYHVFMLDPLRMQSFSGKINEAFGLDFAITRIGNPVRAYVGKELGSGDSLASDRLIPKVGELLLDQGDGLRSYVGILAEVMAMDHPIVLLDEPEAFLHPPQAKRLGKTVVSDLQPTRQAFIATHSSDFLQGALTAQSSRVKVLRLDKETENRRVTTLMDQQLREAVKHPAIANSNLLDSLFFEQTVICEGDADCKLFESVVDSGEWGSDSDRFWFSTGGKHQFPKIASLLQSFGSDWRAILDLDALLNWELLAELANHKGLDISSRKRRIASALRLIQPADLSQLRKDALRALEIDESDELALRNVARILEGRKFSSALKQYGLTAIRNGQERADVEALLHDLGQAGICLLPMGELESYVPSIGVHGPGWVTAVLESPAEYAEPLARLREDLRAGLI